MVRTQTEAKRFFVEKVLTQARVDRVPVSDAERKMLSWSESDPDGNCDPMLPVQLESEISDQEYEEKVAGLLARCFQADTARDPATEVEWRRAADVLGEGDHYILHMLARAQETLSAPTRRPHLAARAGLFVLLVVPGAIALAMAAGIVVVYISGEVPDDSGGRLAGAFGLIAGVLILGSVGAYLFRLWFTERRRWQAR